MNEPYIPKIDYNYPDKPYQHEEIKGVTHNVIVDENYPYLDKSFKFRFVRFWMHIVIYIIVFQLTRIRFGLKIEGREILRRNKKLFKNGAMTVSNHIHRWDLLFVLQAVRYRMIFFPAWKENLNTSDENFVRLAGITNNPYPAEGD